MKRLIPLLVTVVLVAGAAVAVYSTQDRWIPWLSAKPAAEPKPEEPGPAASSDVKMVSLTPEARKNLGLVSKPVRLQEYWRTIQVPAVLVDRPGLSDRGVPSPTVGIVTEVHAFPGDTVRTGDRLVTLRVFSEYLQNTQSELFKSTREVELVTEQKDRLEKAAKTGAVAESRVIELTSQLRRLTAVISAHRQDLLTRGLNKEQIDRVAEGEFVTTIEVQAPPVKAAAESGDVTPIAYAGENDTDGLAFEVQELKVSLGDQVQAGQVLCLLANHRELYIEGHAFKQDAPFLEQAAQNSWPIQIEFAEDAGQTWPTLDQTFTIRHLANSIDPESRTFDFFIPLSNQSRSYQKDGQTFLVWRFRPGQRARLHVPVEKIENSIVLPATAVVREGPEAYVFTQNGDLFERLPVHIRHEDRRSVVIVSGRVKPGLYVAQNAAAALNRVLKSQANTGLPPGYHVHADGSVHGGSH